MVARSDAHLPGMQAVVGSILTSGNILSRFGHEIISTASLSLPLIQGQLSVTGERICTDTIKVYIQTTGICDSHLL